VRAVGYFREQNGRSLAEQSEAFLEFCERNGYEAAAAFLDTGISSPPAGFRQLVEFVRQQSSRGFMLVVLPHISGLGATPTDAVRRYFQLSGLGVSVVSMEDGPDVEGALMDLWSRYRANGSLGERVKAAMRKKAVKGEALGRPPYGYRVGAKHRLVIESDEGSVVRYIFRLYIKDGLGIRRIARRINEEDLKTRRGGYWSMVTVRDVLRNRAYVGTYARFGVRVPASHAPLISQEDFQQVQERLDARRPSSKVRQISAFVLSGVAFCGYCGNKMIGVTRRQKWKRRGDGALRSAQYRYYQCESRTNRSLCDYHPRRADDLEEAARRAVSSLRWTRKPARAALLTASDANAQAKRARERSRRLDRVLERYLDSAALGKITPEKLRSLGADVAGEQLELEERLLDVERLAQHEATESERQQRRDEIVRRLRDEWKSLDPEELRDLLQQVIARIVVKDDGLEIVPGS